VKSFAAAISCRWCGRACRLRRGGSPQVFCGPACRTAFHTATRRWAESAVDAGFLTVDHIRNGDPAACTLLPGAILPAPLSDDHREAEDLLNDLALALRALPEVAWLRAVRKLPDALFERLDRWMEARLA
jgi:hypothetical protein